MVPRVRAGLQSGLCGRGKPYAWLPGRQCFGAHRERGHEGYGVVMLAGDGRPGVQWLMCTCPVRLMNRKSRPEAAKIPPTRYRTPMPPRLPGSRTASAKFVGL